MTWLRLEDNMLDHPKWRRALREGGDEVLATWVRLVSWCSRHLTDGVVPADMVAQVAEVRSVERSRTLRALADAGLIEFSQHSDEHLTDSSRAADVIVTDYLERNPSRQQVLTERSRRTECQRNRRLVGVEAGIQSGTVPRCNEVPSRPVPSRPVPVPKSADPERACRTPEPEPPSSPEVTVIQPITPAGGTSRTYSLPSAVAPKEFLDEALMGGVSREQAQSTWEHYYGDGLPARGVERVYPWLVKRAKERAVSTAKIQARAGPRGGSDRGAVLAMMSEELERQRAEEAEEEARKGVAR